LKLIIANSSSFNSIHSRLQKLYDEYHELPNRCKKEREQTLLNIYLDKFFIEKHSIPNIGKQRAFTLASYGIETAADISYEKVIKIPSFGPVLTQNLVDWRNTIASSFHKYKPSQNELISLTSINQKYDLRRREIETNLVKYKTELSHERKIIKQKLIDHIDRYQSIKNNMEYHLISAKSRLTEISQNLIERQKKILKEAENLAKQLAQARADMEVYS